MTYGQRVTAVRVGRTGKGRVLGSLAKTITMTLRLISRDLRMVIARKMVKTAWLCFLIL
jgi:hypothetical protein